MSGLMLMVLILAMSGYSDAAWCTCRSDVSDSSLQKTLDYACGAGADCGPILQNGPCFQPNTVRAHCSYAVNSYFQKKGQAPGSCEFSSTAVPSQTDPSPGGTCSFPSSASSTGSTTTPSTTTPSTSTNTNNPSTTTPSSTFSPNNPTTGVMGGGIGAGLGPSGTGISTDANDAAAFSTTLHKSNFLLLLTTLGFSGLLFLWG